MSKFKTIDGLTILMDGEPLSADEVEEVIHKLEWERDGLISTIERLQSQHDDNYESMLKETMDRQAAENRLNICEQLVQRYRDAIQKYFDGDYPHPRSYRPNQCPHKRYYYEECCECDSEWFIKALSDEQGQEQGDG